MYLVLSHVIIVIINIKQPDIFILMINTGKDGKKVQNANHNLYSYFDILIDPMTGSSIGVSSATEPNVEIVRQQRFEVGPRYTDLKFIGEGAYGKPYAIESICYSKRCTLLFVI